jgi:Ca-activated chloride channel family protein
MPALMEVDLLPADTDTRPNEAGFGTLRTEQGNLPLVALDVRGRADGLATQIDVSQTFRNAGPTPLEATYIFPLPDRLAVRDFRLDVAGRTIQGVLQERGQARANYDQAIRTGQRAAIAEEERPGVFTMRVGNLPAGESATVRLTLVGTLPCTDNEVTFRFPLVVAERYIPGQALDAAAAGSGTAVDTNAVPDASRISPPVLLPGCPNPVRLTLSLDIYPVGGVPISAVRSSLHSVIDLENDTGVRRIMVKAGERLDRDFIVRYRLGNEVVQTACTLVPDSPEASTGVFALTVLPPLEAQAALRPRDVVFLLDRSGSMGGWKMVTARSALAQIVNTLTPRDRFSILAFDHAIDSPPELPYGKLHSATERARYLAGEYLSTVAANGGTELAQPLQTAVHLLAGTSPERDRVLVLLTDGQVGNEDQLLHGLNGQIDQVRIYTVGIDTAVNEGFLRRLAEAGRGEFTLVESAERLDSAVARVHQHIGTPTLQRLALTSASLTLSDLAPSRLPDLFVGASVTILGRYEGTVGPVRLTGQTPTGQEWTAHIPAVVSSSPALPAAWARARVRALEDAYTISASTATEQAIVATSLRYGVLSRFTAFVAIDQAEVVNSGGHNREVTQAVESAKPVQHRLERVRAAAPASANLTQCGAVMSAAPADDEDFKLSTGNFLLRSSARLSRLASASEIGDDQQVGWDAPAPKSSGRRWVVLLLLLVLAIIVGVWWLR